MKKNYLVPKNALIIIALALLIMVNSNSSFAQSLQHPILYTTDGERTELLKKIKDNKWASDLVASMKSNVDSKLNAHKTNPSGTFSNVPEIRANDGNSESSASSFASAHGKMLSTAAYSGMLYHITQEEKYASFSADILAYYFDILGARTEATTTITGNYFYDPRTTYDQLAIAYDFIYDYLKVSGRKVYNKAGNKQVAYDHAKAQKVIRNIAARTLNEAGGADNRIGGPVSNHPVLTAPGSLFPIFCIDDQTERERLFNLFWIKGTKRQNSFTKTILKSYSDQYIWPESPSYGFMPNTLLILNVVDRIKPGLNAAKDYVKLFESPSLLENLRLPIRYFVRYGDSHRKQDGTDDMNRWTLNYAKRRGNTNLQKGAEIALKQSFPETNGYSTKVPDNGFGNYNALQLFWGETIPEMNAPKFDYKPTVVINHAGVALQRNYSDEDTKEYGLVGIIGGANYVHAHLTGITMELYGCGDVMAPNGGLPKTVAERSKMPFQGYFNRYAGNNTVVVNGTSHGSKKATWGGNKEIGQDRTENIAAEPKHLEDPIGPNFSFATQFLDDNVNNCDQQRTLSTIRTSATTAYYLDVFRSKSNGTNNFHDYIYHNIGDATKLTDAADKALSLTTTTKYQNDIGDAYKSPGWRTFEQTKSSVEIDKAVNIRFDLNTTKRYMHMLVPGGVKREYTTAVGPGTYEALNGYEDKKTQIVAIRQKGEAWNKPYVSVFEPSKNATSSVQSVENLTSGSKIVGAKVVSVVGGKTITDYIISNENASDTYTSTNPAITFKGRFGIVRVEDKQTTLYIGEGTSLVYESNTLTADAKKRGLKVFSGNQDPNKAPTVNITSPANNATFEVGERITLSADADDSDGTINNVNFRINDEFYNYDGKAPFTAGFTPTAPGTYKISAVARDNEELETEVFVTITVIEKNVAPTASFTTPTSNMLDEGYSSLVVTVDAADPNGDAITVVLKIDGKEIRSESVAPYEWGHTGSPNPSETVGLTIGDHIFEAVVTDAKGLSTTISKTITVDKVTGTTSIVDRYELTVFPNPSKSGVFKLSEASAWEVYNLSGVNVLSNKSDQVNLSSEPKGIYFLKVNEKVIRLIHLQ